MSGFHMEEGSHNETTFAPQVLSEPEKGRISIGGHRKPSAHSEA
mgnify:CR=1 FL=1